MPFPKIQCNNCKDIIQSSYSGEFVKCKCAVESDKKIKKLYEKEIKNNPGKYRELEPSPIGTYFPETNEGHKLRCDLAKEHGTGIFIDSTNHYSRYGGAGLSHGKAGFTVIDDAEEEKEL